MITKISDMLNKNSPGLFLFSYSIAICLRLLEDKLKYKYGAGSLAELQYMSMYARRRFMACTKLEALSKKCGGSELMNVQLL